jgi:hypothetical protein
MTALAGWNSQQEEMNEQATQSGVQDRGCRGAALVRAAPVIRPRSRWPTADNLHVTGMTAYSVSLAWNPSTDNSGSVIYTICCANVSSETFPGPASSRVYRAGLEAGRSFTLRISARDPSGNVSGYSNSVTFTLPRDTTPPTKPMVSVTDVGSTHVSLAWSSSKTAQCLVTVYQNGARLPQRGIRRPPSARFSRRPLILHRSGGRLWKRLRPVIGECATDVVTEQTPRRPTRAT